MGGCRGGTTRERNGGWNKYISFLAGVMAVERIAERSLAEGRGNKISLVLEHSQQCDAVEVVLMGTCPSPFSLKWNEPDVIRIHLY